MQIKRIKVVHLAPHVGGGVGSVLIDWLNDTKNDTTMEHTLACLDACHPASLEKLSKYEINYEDNLYKKDRKQLIDIIEQADVVLLHYWNHPLLAHLLVTDGLPSCRLICWCHISGLHEPSIIPSYLIDLADKIIFTSDISRGAKKIQEAIEINSEKFETIHSTRNLDPFLELAKKRKFSNNGKNLVYIGTVSYDKLHPDTLSIITKLSQRGFKISIIGGPDNAAIERELDSESKDVKFIGPVENIYSFLSEADIFIYPLCQTHYGTGEQAVLEAMASGLPVVAFNNPAESNLISNNFNGLLVHNSDEFVGATISISESIEPRKRMSDISTQIVKKLYSSRDNILKFNKIFQEVVLINKRKHLIPVAINCEDSVLKSFILNTFQADQIIKKLLYSNQDAERIDIISGYIYSQVRNHSQGWISSTKGSPKHYLRYFPDSICMAEICRNIALI